MGVIFDPILSKLRKKDESVLFDTESEILALTPNKDAFYVATDTKKIYYWNATTSKWNKTDLPLTYKDPSGDMGSDQGSNKNGYATGYITDKYIANCSIGGNADGKNGGIRFYDSELQVYIDGWQTALTGIEIRQVDPNNKAQIWNGEIWVDMHTGESDILGVMGVPVIRNYEGAMGAYGARMVYRSNK